MGQKSRLYTCDHNSGKTHSIFIIFTARRYASAVYAIVVCLSVCVSVCLSVCLSVTSRCSTKMAKHRKTQITPKRYKIATYFQWKTNSKSYVACRMAPVLLTLNDLEGHTKVISRLQAASSAIRRTFVQHFTRFQLTALHDQLYAPKWAWSGSRDHF